MIHYDNIYKQYMIHYDNIYKQYIQNNMQCNTDELQTVIPWVIEALKF